jgi:hypothetical protein
MSEPVPDLLAALIRSIEAAKADLRATTTHEDDMSEQRQVWCVAYDSDTPNMDGSVTPVRMAEMPEERAIASLEILRVRSSRAPKRNLRIETRWVTPWTPTTHEAAAVAETRQA